MAEDTLVDFAVVAFREDGQWQVATLPHRVGRGPARLLHALRQQPSEGPTLAALLLRRRLLPRGAARRQEVRLMISDASAAGEWPVARQALGPGRRGGAGRGRRGSCRPAGDLEIFADLGVSAMELAAICCDLELYPDEMLGADRRTDRVRPPVRAAPWTTT